MNTSEIYQRVKESYQNALTNGHNLDLLSPQEVAEDMNRNDADLEKVPYSYLLEAVKTVQNKRLLQG